MRHESTRRASCEPKAYSKARKTYATQQRWRFHRFAYGSTAPKSGNAGNWLEGIARKCGAGAWLIAFVARELAPAGARSGPESRRLLRSRTGASSLATMISCPLERKTPTRRLSFCCQLKRGLARYNRLARRLWPFAFGRVLAVLGGLLVAGERRSLGLFTLVPRVTTIAGTRRQAGVLSEDLGGLLACHFMAASRCRVLATGALVAVGGRLMQRNQLGFSRPDQVGAAHAGQRFTQHWPAFRVVITQERLLQTTLLFALDDGHGVALVSDLTQRVLARVVHRGGGSHRRRVERLHLVGAEAVALEPQGQVHHVFVGGARVGGDEVRNQVLLFPGFLGVLLEHALELVIAANARLHHLVERTFLGVFRGDLQVTTHVVSHQLLDVFRRLDREVVAQAGSDQDLLHTRQGTGAAIQLDQRRVVGVQVRANAREHARWLAARGFDFRGLAGDAVHVRGRAAEVGNDAGRSEEHTSELQSLANDRLFGTVLDDPPFVLGDGAERTAAEATSHEGHRETDHVVGRDLLLAIRRVRDALIRHAEHVVHFFGGHRNRWRVEPDVDFAVLLYQRAGVARVGFQVKHAVGVSVENRITTNLFHR